MRYDKYQATSPYYPPHPNYSNYPASTPYTWTDPAQSRLPLPPYYSSPSNTGLSAPQSGWPDLYGQPVGPSMWPYRRRMGIFPSPEPDDTESLEWDGREWGASDFRDTWDDRATKLRHRSSVLPRKGSSSRRRNSLRSYGADSPFDPLNLAPRPANWRHDYNAPHSAKPRRFSLRGHRQPYALSKSAPGGKPKFALHPSINYISKSNHPLAHDLRSDPDTTSIQFLHVLRYSNSIDFYQLATNPPVHGLCLYHAKLPWTITVQASGSNGVTVGDIFSQVFQNLSTQVSRQDFYNTALNPSDREEMTTSFYYRQGHQEGYGLRRMDFLGFDVVFMGLTKGKHGLLEIKTRPADSE